jgi:membrane-bound lytic murein transglycosylase D
MNTHILKLYLISALLLFSINGSSVNENPLDVVIEEFAENIPTNDNAADSVAFAGDEEVALFDSSLNNLFSSQFNENNSDCTGGENPQFPEDEYKQRLSKLPNIIELPYNKIIQTYIDFYLVKRREQVSNMIAFRQYFFPIFENALEANDMPMELVYLPVIESALNPNAVSKAGAAGLWQFMPATGRMYGLTINSLVDERRDPLKSTQAGVKYLKDLYNIYNDWHLAIAAYNCGPGNVNKAIRRSGGKKDYWAIYNFLPRETRGYVPAFIAANYVMNYYNEHNICPAEIAEAAMLTDTIIVKDRMHLQQVADVLSIPIQDLRFFNPQYRRDVIPGNISEYALALPHNYLGSFIDQKDSILNYKADELINNLRTEVAPAAAVSYAQEGSGNKVYYKVKSGDSLGKIASNYRVSVSSIKRWNGLPSNMIRIGQRLVIYTASSGGTSSASSYNAATSTYTVRSGDNLWSIAQKFPGITSNDISRANNLQNNNIKPGQTLKIPKK